MTSIKTLLMDVGNSYLKWALLSENTISTQHSLSYKDKSAIHHFEQIIEMHRAECDSLVMVSVLGDTFSKASQRILLDKQLQFIKVTSQTELAGIKNAYDEPHKLGTDRLLAMIAAYRLVNTANVRSQACIVIDTGTATTIDAVDENGQHLGGVILPGLELSSTNLLDNTELLPLWNNDSEFKPNILSTETSQAISSGCLLALAGGIDNICNNMVNELIDRSVEKSIQVKKIICGGAAKKLLPYMQLDYQYNEDLIMLGLKAIKEESVK